MSGSSERAAVLSHELTVNQLMAAARSRGPRCELPSEGVRRPRGSRTTSAAGWAEKLIDVLWFEVEDAAGRAVITEAESEQLLARLVLVIDQALSATGTSP